MQTPHPTMAGEFPLPARRAGPTRAARNRVIGYAPSPRTAGNVDTNPYFSYAPVRTHSTPMFNPENLDASTDDSQSPTGLTCTMEMTDASRRHLDYSDRTGGNQGTSNAEFFPSLDVDAVASILGMDDGTTDQAYEAEAYKKLFEADRLAQSQEQQRQVEAMEMAGGMTEDTSFLSSPSSGGENLCISFPFMEPAHEEMAEGPTASRKRKKSFGREVGRQQELAMSCEVEHASFGFDHVHPCWMPGEKFVDHVTQSAQAEVEMLPPLVGEMEGDASLQPEEGGSGGEEEELGNKKPGVDQSALRRAQGKDRRAALNASLKAMKSLFTATVRVKYNKWSQLEHVLGARDTIEELTSNLEKSLAYSKALEIQLAALSSLPTSILSFLASQPSPFHNKGMGYSGVANQYQNQFEVQAIATSTPPLVMMPSGHCKLKAKIPPQLQIQTQPRMLSQPQLPSQLQRQLQPQRLFRRLVPKPSRPLMPAYEQPPKPAPMPAPIPAPMPAQPEIPYQHLMQPHRPDPLPSQPDLPAYEPAQMQPLVMHQLLTPQAAYPPDDMTFSGMEGQMSHGRGGGCHTFKCTDSRKCGEEGSWRMR